MKPRKIRRNSGRRYPRCSVPLKILNEEGIQLKKYWDDWLDWRDGMRDWTYFKWKQRDKKKKPWRKK